MGNYMNGVGLIDISELEGEQTHKAQMQEIWLLLIYCSDIFPHKPPASAGGFFTTVPPGKPLLNVTFS